MWQLILLIEGLISGLAALLLIAAAVSAGGCEEFSPSPPADRSKQMAGGCAEMNQSRAGGTENHTRLITSEIVGATPTPVNQWGETNIR